MGVRPSAEGMSSALAGPRVALKDEGTGTDMFDRERQKSQPKQRTAIVAAVTMMAERGLVTVPF